MTWIGRTSRVGKALAAGALIGLAGCHQLPMNSVPSTPRAWNGDPKADGKITAAQEADVQISLGRVAEQQGDLEQAMAAYRAALSRDKRRADASLRLGVLYDKQGKFRQSAEFYNKALALRPGDPDIFCDMGYSFYLQRRWSEAEMNLRQALALDPDHKRAHNNLALLLAHDNRCNDAVSEFLKGGSDPSQAHLNLAFALTLERRWGAARAEYQRALELDPSSELARTRLNELNALAAKLEPVRDNSTPDPRVVTTSTTIPKPQRRSEVQTAAPKAMPERQPEVQAAAPKAKPRRRPEVQAAATKAKNPPPRRVPIPQLPASPEGSSPFTFREAETRKTTRRSTVQATDQPSLPPLLEAEGPKTGPAAILPQGAQTPTLPPLQSAP